MQNVLYYFIAVNVIGAVVCIYDKLAAARGWKRVPERTLFFWALVGGGPGVTEGGAGVGRLRLHAAHPPQNPAPHFHARHSRRYGAPGCDPPRDTPYFTCEGIFMTKALIRLFIKNAEDTRSAAVREQYGILSGAVGLACNLFLFALKLTIGLVTGAISIAADAFNNLSDGLSCMISIVGFKVANREPDEKHPFGYGRTEYIAGLIVSFIILLVGFEFFKTSLDRIIHPSAVAFSALLTGILAVSMLVKLWMGLFNTTLGRRIDSPVLIAAGQDSRNDVITTSVVVLGMVAGRFTPLPVDGYVGILVAAFIIWSGIGIARDTVAPLLGEAADPVMAKNIEHIVLDSEHIVGVHDLIVHNYGAGRALASLHAEVPSDSNFVAVHEEIDEAEKRVWQQTGVYLVIHMDPVEIHDATVLATKEKVRNVISILDPELSFHDFRMISGAEKKKLIFDLEIPYSYKKKDCDRVIGQIGALMKEMDEKYECVVNIDKKYVAGE